MIELLIAVIATYGPTNIVGDYCLALKLRAGQ